LLGSPLAETSRGFRIEADPCPIVVAVECSGARYFCVLLALLAGLAIRRRRWRVLPVLVPIAYGVTLAANSARIACGWYVRRAAAEMFPPQTMPAVHVATGSLCFVAFLVLVYTAIDGRLAHDAAKSAA
jgi:exosortase K